MSAQQTTQRAPTAAITDEQSATIAGRLKHLRTTQNITQTRLAIMANTTATHIMDMENGWEDFEGRLTEIAEALNCNPLWLETGLGGMEANSQAPIELEDCGNLSRLFIELGAEFEKIDESTRPDIARLLLKLAKQPDQKHLIALEAQNTADAEEWPQRKIG